MTSRSLRHRLASKPDAVRLVRARRVPAGPPPTIRVQLETTVGGNLISQSFLIMDGAGHRAQLTGYAQSLDGFSYLTVPVTVRARVT